MDGTEIKRQTSPACYILMVLILGDQKVQNMRTQKLCYTLLRMLI